MLKFTLFGTPHIQLGEEPVTAFKTLKERALFYYLAVTKQTHTRHTLAGLFWGESGEEQAKNSLRVALAQLKKLFPHHLEMTRLSVSFNADRPHELDLEHFVQVVHAHGPYAEMPTIDRLQWATQLYRGDFLADFRIEDAPAFAEWVQGERTRLRELALDAARTLADLYLAHQEYVLAGRTLEFLLQLDPPNEPAHRDLMLAYARIGEPVRAIAQYAVCCQVLETDFRLEPMPATTALYERIHTSVLIPLSWLPAGDPAFLGRGVELTQLDNMLRNPEVRLLTIVGFGGIGKTQLALAAAHRANAADTVSFLNGVVYVALAGVESVDLLPLVLAEALGFKLAGRASPDSQLISYLRNKEILVVLDNFEHLLDGVTLLATILGTCPDVKLMVTSREPLQLSMEWRLDLEGLPYPRRLTETGSELQRFEAVQLLMQTARQVCPDFTMMDEVAPAICQLCQMVGGSPLALKLAILWLDTMSLPQIVAELARSLDLLATELPDWPLRQRSMKAIFDYTYALLNPLEQRTLQHISVFRSGFTEEAAIDVANASPYALTGLVDRGLLKLLVTAHDVRYEIHELTRQYAAAKVPAQDALALHNRHCAYFARYVGHLKTHIFSAQYMIASDGVATELNNIRAAWQWLREQIELGRATENLLPCLTQFAPTLSFFYHLRTQFSEGRRAFEQMAQAMMAAGWDTTDDDGLDGIPRQTALARIAVQIAAFCYDMADYERVDEIAAQIEPLLRTTGQHDDLGMALLCLAKADIRRGVFERATQLLHECLTLCQTTHNRAQAADALSTLAVIANSRGDYPEGERLDRESLAIYEELGYTPGIARILCNLGTNFVRQERFDEGVPYYEQALALAEAGDIRATLMITISNLGSVHRSMRRFEQSIQNYTRALQMSRAMGDQRWIAANLIGLGKVYLETDDLGAASRTLNEGLDVAYAIESAPDTLGSISLLAHIWAQRGHIEEALRALIFSEEHPATMASSKRYQQTLLSELYEELPPQLIESARSWSEAQTLPDLVDWVLSSRPS